MIVVDASVAMKWYAQEQGTAQANLLLDARPNGLELLVPDIFLAKTVNALLRKVRTGQMSHVQLDEARNHLRLLDLPTIASTAVMDRAVTLSQHLDHSIYDCLYLACAERMSAVLVTADHRFARKLTGSGSSVVILDGVDDLLTVRAGPP